jgi:hypothetical protein
MAPFQPFKGQRHRKQKSSASGGGSPRQVHPVFGSTHPRQDYLHKEYFDEFEHSFLGNTPSTRRSGFQPSMNLLKISSLVFFTIAMTSAAWCFFNTRYDGGISFSTWFARGVGADVGVVREAKRMNNGHGEFWKSKRVREGGAVQGFLGWVHIFWHNVSVVVRTHDPSPNKRTIFLPFPHTPTSRQFVTGKKHYLEEFLEDFDRMNYEYEQRMIRIIGEQSIRDEGINKNITNHDDLAQPIYKHLKRCLRFRVGICNWLRMLPHHDWYYFLPSSLESSAWPAAASAASVGSVGSASVVAYYSYASGKSSAYSSHITTKSKQGLGLQTGLFFRLQLGLHTVFLFRPVLAQEEQMRGKRKDWQEYLGPSLAGARGYGPIRDGDFVGPSMDKKRSAVKHDPSIRGKRRAVKHNAGRDLFSGSPMDADGNQIGSGFDGDDDRVGVVFTEMEAQARSSEHRDGVGAVDSVTAGGVKDAGNKISHDGADGLHGMKSSARDGIDVSFLAEDGGPIGKSGGAVMEDVLGPSEGRLSEGRGSASGVSLSEVDTRAKAARVSFGGAGVAVQGGKGSPEGQVWEDGASGTAGHPQSMKTANGDDISGAVGPASSVASTSVATGGVPSDSLHHDDTVPLSHDREIVLSDDDIVASSSLQAARVATGAIRYLKRKFVDKGGCDTYMKLPTLSSGNCPSPESGIALVKFDDQSITILCEKKNSRRPETLLALTTAQNCQKTNKRCCLDAQYNLNTVIDTPLGKGSFGTVYALKTKDGKESGLVIKQVVTDDKKQGDLLATGAEILIGAGLRAEGISGDGQRDPFSRDSSKLIFMTCSADNTVQGSEHRQCMRRDVLFRLRLCHFFPW